MAATATHWAAMCAAAESWYRMSSGLCVATRHSREVLAAPEPACRGCCKARQVCRYRAGCSHNQAAQA